VLIQDASGKTLQEVTLRLDAQEVTELMVAASELDDGSKDHALVRDPAGVTLAVYSADQDAGPIARQTDWWLGPLILVGVVLMVAGAFTLARGAIGLLF
jgi:hypothetical protein